MTISLLLPSITDAISQLSVSGVTIRDYDGIVANWQSTPNVLYPNPETFVANFRPEYQSFTRGASAQVDLRYTLNYRFLGTQVGSLATFPVAYADVVTKAMAIVAKIIETTAPYDGRVDMEIGGLAFGPRDDPAGNMYHGADIALNIMEMQNT